MAIERQFAEEAARQLAEKATAFLEKVVGPPLEELGGLLADKVKYWRFKNQVNTIVQAEAFLTEKQVTPGKVPLRTLIPLLEEASWEEDGDMQTKWASLLASAADPAQVSPIESSYVEILKQLSPTEVGLLDSIYDEYIGTDLAERAALMFGRDALAQRHGLDPNLVDLLLDNLFRLNVLQPPASHGGVSVGDYPIVLRTHDMVQLTDLGIHFIRTCRYGQGEATPERNP